MKFKYVLLIIWLGPLIYSCKIKGQTPEQKQIDSLINILITQRREWNEASELLITIGESTADELISILVNKSFDSWVRRKAAMTLSGVESELKIEPCINVYSDNTDDLHVRVSACNALSKINIDKFEELFLHWATDKNQAIRIAAYNRLAQIGSEKAINFLINEIDSQKDMAHWIILHIIEKVDSDEVNEKFIKALDDEVWWMINEYAREVLITKGENVIESLHEILLNKENSDFMRWKAIWVIKDLNTDKKYRILQNGLNDSCWLVRNEAEVALNK